MKYFLFLLIIYTPALLAQKQGRARIDSLINELPHYKDDTNKVRILNAISYLYNGYDAHAGVANGEAALKLSEQLQWDNGKASAYNSIAINYCNLGNTDTAIEYISRALTINERTGNKMKTAQNLGNIGNIYFMQSNYAKALEYYFRTLKIFEEIKDSSEVANELCNIGSVYHMQHNYPMALRYDTTALNNYRTLRDKPGEAISQGNTGNEYNALGDYKKALEELSGAMKIYEVLGNSEGIARNLSNIGDLYSTEGNYYEALTSQSRAMNIYQKLGDKSGVARSFGYLGQCYLATVTDTTSKNKYMRTSSQIARVDTLHPGSKTECLRKANNYLAWAVGICKEIGYLDYVQDFSKSLSEAQYLSGNYKAAFATFKQYTYYKDSVFNKENNKKITDLEHKRELESKDLQIQLLAQANRVKDLRAEKETLTRRILIGSIVMVMIIALSIAMYFVRKQESDKQLANEKINTLLKEQELSSVSNMLEAQEQERKRIAADLHDRLGSMLSTVKLYFNSVEEQVDKLKEQNREQYHKATTLLDDACDEVRKIAHNLVSGELVKFGLVSGLNQMKGTIEDTGKLKMNVLAFGLESRLEGATEISLYRVVQELLNNILKHAMATEVTIQLNKVENNLNIVVEDNGVGFDVAAAREKDGMGLRNMETRVKKLNGVISFDSGKGRGTTTIIDIPV